jgi:hypothetical protein
MRLKRLILILAAIAAFALVIYAETIPPQNFAPAATTAATRTRPYDILVTSVDANDTALVYNTRYWDAIKTNFKPVDNTYNYMEFAFLCQKHSASPAGVTFHFQIYAARWYCSAVKVYSGTATCGTLETSRDTNGVLFNANGDPNTDYRWVSGITEVADTWITRVNLADATTLNNGIARVTMDLRGYGLVWCEITSITGTPLKIMCVATGY